MRLTLRLSLLLIFGVAAVSLGFAFYETRAETSGLKNDLDRQSRLLAESLAKSAEPLVARRSYRELQTLVNRFQDRERIAGVAIFDANRKTLAISAGLAARLKGDADAVQRSLSRTFDNNLTNSEFVRAHDDAGGLHIAVTALRDENDPLTPLIGALAVFHDTTYIDAQIAELWRRALIGVAVQTFLIGSITLLMIRWGVGRPMQRMAQWM
ncbi:MAG TPA: hypothetical protein VKS01_07155, partial [Bryobacteraceae bacterium]|nr:hypothetical protein [Bryobacteraceae bacterium]